MQGIPEFVDLELGHFLVDQIVLGKQDDLAVLVQVFRVGQIRLALGRFQWGRADPIAPAEYG